MLNGSWYAARRRPPPRNGPFANARELTSFAALLGARSRHVVRHGASAGVAESRAPSCDRGTARVHARGRLARRGTFERGTRPSAICWILPRELSPGARDTLESHYGELVQLSTTIPDAWILTSRGSVGSPPITEAIELRLVLAGARAAIVRRRTWIE